jgi:hypothetical protein
VRLQGGFALRRDQHLDDALGPEEFSSLVFSFSIWTIERWALETALQDRRSRVIQRARTARS